MPKQKNCSLFCLGQMIWLFCSWVIFIVIFLVEWFNSSLGRGPNLSLCQIDCGCIWRRWQHARIPFVRTLIFKSYHESQNESERKRHLISEADIERHAYDMCECVFVFICVFVFMCVCLCLCVRLCLCTSESYCGTRTLTIPHIGGLYYGVSIAGVNRRCGRKYFNQQWREQRSTPPAPHPPPSVELLRLCVCLFVCLLV